MILRKLTLLLLSIACYVYFVQGDIVYFLALSVFIILSNRLDRATGKKMMSILAVCSLIAGFVVIKFASHNNMLLGYSVFAFCGISFVIDQHRTGRKYGMIDMLLFLFFFPKMIAGPIVRINDFTKQLTDYAFSLHQLYLGLKLLIYACFLKFFVADIVLNIDMAGSGINLFIQTVVWGIRFYLDFYAYSLLAVGMALAVGINLPFNFDNPYSALTFRDFWRRWNITLTQWLGKYVYIPLGGSRCRHLRTCLNVLITFIVSGLWHGITMTFIMWGICHGILVSIEHQWMRQPPIGLAKRIYRMVVVLATLFLWQLFRLSDLDQVADYTKHLFSSAMFDVQMLNYGVLACLLLCLIESRIVKRLMLGYESSRLHVISEVSTLSLMLVIMMLCPLHFSFNFFYLKF